MERIGFIGLGNMGKPIAENLARAGFPMTVLDLNPAPVDDLIAQGATAATSPREIAEASDIICSVVMNDRQTHDVFFGDSGVLAGAEPGSLILIHSTISQEMCKTLGEAALDKGIHILDAAVSGAEAKAKEGKLTVLVGGDADQVERAKPIFNVIGAQTFHVGSLGMGQAAKVCNNLLCLVNVQVVEEALDLARKAGIDEDVMRDIVLCSSGNSWSHENIHSMRELGNIHTGGNLDMSIFGRKDISLASKLAARVGALVPITDFIFDRMKK